MYLYLGFVDVVANAFYELLKKQRKREILFSDLDKYGAKVTEKVNEDQDVYAVYAVSQESQKNLFISYSDYFEPFQNESGARGIKLKDNIDEDAIWNRFCVAISLRFIKAFRAKESVAVLGV